MRKSAAAFVGSAITLFARIVTAPRAIWSGIEPLPKQRVYFANHTSNADFVLLWTVLPPMLRARTRPVAALEYWLKTPLRAFIGRDVFNAVLIDRRPEERVEDPVALMGKALAEGSSLILFPEGVRNMTEEPLLPFRTGLYHLARQNPEIDLVPVWISNLNRVMPKGEIIPLPLICTLTFGAPLHLGETEDKADFLARSHAALIALKETVPA
ncbi:1-acyl-sn-glycerol-3-phosphate acyltransferase [Pseudomonas sp. GX19020]|uniref:lysophospholipid acyltransferase family protein n=1 Tax=Pseudomonas sp. GX19020 TaxID=2942277 RepID=UPI002019CD78|nr:lysophospholipid acyltransferase family protein [Pseudomonas sp. GX19020]MCL4066729.1 1-acyl-sn-glycerol-3-phosphate acyltransferase [Pseudomonas sp. GX19020]